MTTHAKVMTADELLAMPDDGARRYELVRGELVEMSPAGEKHCIVAARMAVFLGSYVLRHKLGELLTAEPGFHVERDPDTVRAPDVAFLRKERITGGSKFVAGAPDLAIEVLSPDDRPRDVQQKVREYLAAGSGAVIVVDPRDETASVHTKEATTQLTINDTITAEDVLPGWSLPMRELFD